MANLKIICYGCGQKLDVTELKAFTRLRCPVCNTKLTVPKKFGNFLLEEILGAGDLATVYRAMDITLDREIAVKVLNEEFANHPDVPSHFMNEARMASAINHPNVIPIYSCGEMDAQPFLIMQFMPGGGLHRKIDPLAPPPAIDVCRWFLEAAKGLDSAALHGMLHYNLKPCNIFLDLDHNVKIGDFGLVQALTAMRPILQNGRPNVNLAQAHYFAPERLHSGRQEVMGDLYSFGACFYHVLTGQPPYPGDTVEAVLEARRLGMPKAPATLIKDLPNEINALIMATLEPQPAMRPKTYTEIVIALKARLATADKRHAAAGQRSPGTPSGSGSPMALRPAAEPYDAAMRSSTKVITMDEAGEPQYQPPSPAVKFLTRVVIPFLVFVILLLLVLWLTRSTWQKSAVPGGPGDIDAPGRSVPASSLAAPPSS